MMNYSKMETSWQRMKMTKVYVIINPALSLATGFINPSHERGAIRECISNRTFGCASGIYRMVGLDFT